MTRPTQIYTHPPARARAPTSGSPSSRLRLTARDLDILEALYLARYMTSDQICRLFWKDATGTVGPRKACARRLRKLRSHGLIRAIEQPVTRAEASKPYLYTLDQGGAALVSTTLDIDPAEIDWQPKAQEANYPFLSHLLRTTDVRIALVLACAKQGLTLAEWLDEKVLKSAGRKDSVVLNSPEGHQYRAVVVPDAYFVLQRGGAGAKALFFLEVDEGSVTIAPSRWRHRGWVRRVRVYLSYFTSDAYQQRYGDRPARVLTVTNSPERLQHLKEATEAEGGDSRFWFATAADATDPEKLLTANIWSTAGATGRLALLE